ncbi:hypothetical protein FACS189490_06670 [Clostridia bacterium]|nr:hypothetical protein FACS189490_06670 [Clostridia bacterium]
MYEKAVIELLKPEDVELVKELVEDGNRIFSKKKLERFVISDGNYAFIAKIDNEAAGLAYCYTLERLDEAGPMLYIHSVGILPQYQNCGLGTRLMRFIVDFARGKGFSECFVITDRNNPRACKIYEKVGGVSEYEDEVVYVIDLS